MGEYFVYIAKDSIGYIAQSSDINAKPVAQNPNKKTLVALEKKVHPGAVIGSNIIIKDGIKQGDRLIIDGIQSIHDGSPIIVQSSKSKVSGSNNQKSETRNPKQ